MSGTNTLWEVTVNKQFGNEEWANVYHIAVATGEDREDIADEIVAMERGIHDTEVTFVSYRIAPFPGPAEGTIFPLGVQGQRASAALAPLFCVLRVDWPAPTGRPSRKYYRGVLASDEINGQLINSTVFAQIQTDLTARYANFPAGSLVDVDGQALGAPKCFQPVAMRQLRRGNKKKVTP